MRFQQYFAYDANSEKMTASSAYDEKFSNSTRPRVTSIYFEQEVYNVKTERWDVETSRVRD